MSERYFRDDPPVEGGALRARSPLRRRYLDRTAALVLGGLIFVLTTLTACGGSDNADTTGVPGEIEVDLAARGGARVAGARAVLTYQDKQHTRIVVDGFGGGEPVGKDALARVVHGSCDEPGGVAYKLGTLAGDSSETTLDAGLPALLGRDLAVQVLFVTDERDVVACGDLPDKAPDSS
jgi:hypothetical protein